MIYILNTPILTEYGEYIFSGPLKISDAVGLLCEGFESAVGHQATADLLSIILNVSVPPQRKAIQMQAGDSALVFRLLKRIPEGVVLNEEELKLLPYELAQLSRTK